MKLSIVVAVYNHADYILQALDSIKMQKVTFQYEVLIGEDCSKDNTREILKEHEKEYPSNFKFFYREKNYGPDKNFKDLYSKMKGEYFIVLEGDDFWNYEYKLQKQVDFLDNNLDYLACAHNVQIVDENNNLLNTKYKECKNINYSLMDFLNNELPGQTATIMYRNYYLFNNVDTSVENIRFRAGDQRKAFMISSHGKIYCFQKKWSSYRYVTNSGSSFSSSHNNNKAVRTEAVIFYKSLIDYSKRVPNQKDAQKVAETKYILSLLYSYKKGDGVRLKNLMNDYLNCGNKIFILLFVLKKIGR